MYNAPAVEEFKDKYWRSENALKARELLSSICAALTVCSLAVVTGILSGPEEQCSLSPELRQKVALAGMAGVGIFMFLAGGIGVHSKDWENIKNLKVAK